MRRDDDGLPLTHRVRTEQEELNELRLGLDDLLKKGQAIVSREAREKAAKASEDELEALRARRMQAAQALAERFEWRPVAALVMFETQTCKYCGSEHSLFRGFGTLMQQRASLVERWVRADCLDRSLPLQRRDMPSPTPCCVACIEAFTRQAEIPPYIFHPQRSD